MIMAYFQDLSEYEYARSAFSRPGTKAVGWLALGHKFDTSRPTDDLLDLLWLYCSISVAQTRGGHLCEFCPSAVPHYTERNGKSLFLGTSEIRVFSKGDVTYAAPTLIYHYVAAHHYKPPDEFLRALNEGPRPPSREYFERLEKLGLEWHATFEQTQSTGT
jgi:hypothetical protein